MDGASVATVVLGPDARDAAGDVVFCHGTPWSSAVRVADAVLAHLRRVTP